MNRSTKIRYIIFQILIEIFKKNKNFNAIFDDKIAEHDFNQNELTFINNVCLNSMRRSIHSKIILNKFVKKKLKINEFILLCSAITQIVYLKIKPYAVVNETVNVSKKIKVFPGFINAILKNILKNINDVKRTEIKLTDFPEWFVNEIKKTRNINTHNFIDTFYKQPDLHIVFKSEKYLKGFTELYTKSSSKSAFLKVQKKISDIENFYKGEWWVQDFSSMVPLAINNNIKNSNILDMCSAPGGKAFQILLNNRVVLNDISKKRIFKLRENLSRLGFKPEIKNLNALNFDEKIKYDIVLLDSPCSSIGTIRKHPEILFRSKKPNFTELNKLQNNLLRKSAKLVKKNGKIIYMVCSFFHSETIKIIKKFLDENKNFSIKKYDNNLDLFDTKNLISEEGYFFTLPTKYKNNYIDGFFSVELIRND
jgi:16S rRNA (cytosine967-C5)-methyltransferase